MTSVFSGLNFAPETRHHLSRIASIVSNRSRSLRKSVVSSANRETLGFFGAVGMLIPLTDGLDLISQANGSIARSKRAQGQSILPLPPTQLPFPPRSGLT